MVLEPHFRSCLALTQDLTRLGIPHDWYTRKNESLVHRARMGMVARFLRETDFSHLMWLDADIDFSSDDVARLWNMNEDIAVGVYRMKREDSAYSAWIDGKPVSDLSRFREPVEVTYAGTGFMLIKRGVLEDLASKVEAYDNEAEDIPALYMTPIEDRTLLSEDYYFCKLARENGYRIMMHPEVRLGHWGLYRYAD